MSRKGVLLAIVWSLGGIACSSFSKPVPKNEGPVSVLPPQVFFSQPSRAFEVLGTARSWHEFKTSLDESYDEKEFSRRCQQAFYQAAQKVLGIARSHGGDAVMQVKSVVFLADGRKEFYPRPECVDDGEEGEALVEGQVIRWIGVAKKVR